MAKKEKKQKFTKSFGLFLKENQQGLSFALFAVAVIFFALSVIAIFFHTRVGGGFKDFVNYIGNWKYWIIIISIILLLISIYLIYTYNKNLKKFKELMDTDSKAIFVRNIEEIEYLAYELGPAFEDQVDEKKQDLKIK
jgi:hypothetical protein